MYYAYISAILGDPGRYYTGHTSDLKARLAEHSRRNCPHTGKHTLWKIRCYFAFEPEALARNFEHYLKSGSGRSFAKLHFDTDASGQGPYPATSGELDRCGSEQSDGGHYHS